MAHIGIGNAKGDEKAIEAVKLAVASPLLETTINGASHVIINISGDISLMDANDAASYVQDLAGEDANIIFGAKYDETMTDEATITVIATGLENPSMKMKPQQQAGGIGGRMVYPNTNNVRPTGSVGIVSRAAASGNNRFSRGSITAIMSIQVPVWEADQSISRSHRHRLLPLQTIPGFSVRSR